MSVRNSQYPKEIYQDPLVERTLTATDVARQDQLIRIQERLLSRGFHVGAMTPIKDAIAVPFLCLSLKRQVWWVYSVPGRRPADPLDDSWAAVGQSTDPPHPV